MPTPDLQFAAPEERPDLLIIAGEHSGDEHAARILRDVKVLQPELRVAAVGGEALQEAGASLVYDLVEHSVIGFFEVLKNYGFFKSVFNGLLDWVATHRPRHILFVDYPGFNLRFADALHERGLSRKGGGSIGLWYYIAPQVWAWKAKRRFRMAERLDGLGCILPFEEAAFADTALPVRFVGHPFVGETYQLPLVYSETAPVLLLPGSRVQQVERVFPLQLGAFEALLQEMPEVRARAIYPSAKIKAVQEGILESHPAARAAVTLHRNAETVEGSAVLMSSGTMSLACALAGMPGAIVQKVQPLTYLLARALVRIEYIGLANIILKRKHIPEYIQNMDTVDLVEELRSGLSDPERIRRARDGAEELTRLLTAEGNHPSGQWLAECLAT